MTKIKVQDKPNLVRDSETGAIIYNNNEERERFLKQREARKQKELLTKQAIERVEDLDQRVNQIESKLDLILNILQKQS